MNCVVLCITRKKVSVLKYDEFFLMKQIDKDLVSKKNTFGNKNEHHRRHTFTKHSVHLRYNLTVTAFTEHYGLLLLYWVLQKWKRKDNSSMKCAQSLTTLLVNVVYKRVQAFIVWVATRLQYTAVTVHRCVTRLDGARGKKQVWRPRVRTWGLSEANVL